MHQGAAVMPGSRVHHHPSRLINHKDIFVFIHNIQRDSFGLKIRLLDRRNGHLQEITRHDDLPGFAGWQSIDQYLSISDQSLQAGT